MINKKLEAVFFDLDGTLLDTAPDLASAMNSLLREHGRKPVVFSDFRYQVHGGSALMLAHSFHITEGNPEYPTLKEKFFEHYLKTIAHKTHFFDGMDQVLNHLDNNFIPWGIITNKPTRLTESLLSHFDIEQRSCCVVTGDALKVRKPYPDPLLYACQLASCNPTKSVYIGDTEDDIIAAKAAGMMSIAVTYGYHDEHSHPHNWEADAVVNSPLEVLDWLKWMETNLKVSS